MAAWKVDTRDANTSRCSALSSTQNHSAQAIWRRIEALLPKSTDKVTRDSYGVVYGIMRKPYADGTLGLPFFSKVSLQAAAERISQFGIPLFNRTYREISIG
jgi:uncharacterized protein (TIGR04141 family)